jgi:2-polyprenyl-6-methoxyphenol hydroxylase-like FAD-dependent oxidoreductase
MPTDQTTDVIIVGAGPSGLFAALLLHQCGVKIRILDKNDQQAHESRAFALQARSLELFLNLGIVDEFLKRGLIAPGIQLYVNGHKAAQINVTDIGKTDSPYSFVLMLPQSEIEKVFITLLEQRGIKIERNMDVTTFTQNDKGVTLTVANQSQQLTASYLLGADGAHSIVRNVLGLTFEGEAYAQNFMLADCTIDWSLDYAFLKVFLRKNFLGIYFPIKGEEYGRAVAIKPSTEVNSAASNVATTAEPLALPEFATAFDEATGVPIKLSNPVWVTRYRIHHRGVNKYRVARAFVAGDAAHIHSPMGGQGMNTGLQDVANLAWKLALQVKNNQSSDLLDTYNDERWPIGKKLLRFTDAMFGRISSQNKFTAMLRNIIMPLILKIVSNNARCRKNAFWFVSELGIRYHTNPFLLDKVSKQARDFLKALSAGHRAPNGLYKRNQDVFGLLRGYQFHVLALVKKALTKVEIATISSELATLPANLGLPLSVHFIAHSTTGENKDIIQAECNQVFENYGLTDANPQGLFLVRPDGYIAYRSDELNIENLKKFCEMFSGTRTVKKSEVNVAMHTT